MNSKLIFYLTMVDIAVIDGIMVLTKDIHRLPGLQGFTSLPILHLYALEVKEVEESQGDKHIHRQAIGVEKEFEEEFYDLDTARVEWGPIVGPEENQGKLVGCIEDEEG